MAGRITIDSLSDSLKEVIEQSGLTEEQVIELIENNISGDLDLLNTTNKSSLVAAINELFQSANNGKELIANAIGEPVSSEDTFQAMSDDINGLLSQFKTNMMNNGVTVGSNDRFKALIDKIATMVEEGSGKGIQYAEGACDFSGVNSDGIEDFMVTFNHDLPFTPTHIFLAGYVSFDYKNGNSHSIIISNVYETWVEMCSYDDVANIDEFIDIDINLEVININETSFTVRASTIYEYPISFQFTNYCAIGVGGEDTALRDSLASILAGKGVDVAEEDDMASLISKIEGIKSGGLDIISATELPTTGKENQLCVITNNPVDNFVTTSNFNDTSSGIILYTSDSSLYPISLTSGNNTSKYYISKVKQGDLALSSYYYANNTWNPVTLTQLNLLEDGVVRNTNISGGLKSGSVYTANMGVRLGGPAYHTFLFSFVNRIDLSNFSTLEFSVYAASDTTTPDQSIYVFLSNTTAYVGDYGEHVSNLPHNLSTSTYLGYARHTKVYSNTFADRMFYKLDISSINVDGYLNFEYTYNQLGMYCYIADIKLY